MTSENEAANNLLDVYYEKSTEQAQLIAQQTTEVYLLLSLKCGY